MGVLSLFNHDTSEEHKVVKDLKELVVNITADTDPGATSTLPYVFAGADDVRRLIVNNTFSDRCYIEISADTPVDYYEIALDPAYASNQIAYVNTMAVDADWSGRTFGTRWPDVSGYQLVLWQVRRGGFYIATIPSGKQLWPTGVWSDFAKENVSRYGGATNDDGVCKAYTLSEEQYIELDSQIGHVTHLDTPGVVAISGVTVNEGNPQMNQTVFLAAQFYSSDASASIQLQDDFTVGARVRMVDLLGLNQTIILPVGHSLITSDVPTESDDYSDTNGYCVTTTGQYYYTTWADGLVGSGTETDTFEFQYVGAGKWVLYSFDFIGYTNRYIPWARIDKAGAVAADVGALENKMTTNGDMMYKNQYGGIDRLPAGNDGDVLKIVSGIPTWVAP